MRAGDLRHRLTLQDLSETNDGGTVNRQWVNQDTVWASIEGLSGSVRYEAAQVEEDLDTRIELRYREDITADWRGQDENGNIYNFKSISDPTGKDEKMQINAVKDNG